MLISASNLTPVFCNPNYQINKPVIKSVHVMPGRTDPRRYSGKATGWKLRSWMRIGKKASMRRQASGRRLGVAQPQWSYCQSATLVLTRTWGCL
jgi:hypothetical protein